MPGLMQSFARNPSGGFEELGRSGNWSASGSLLGIVAIPSDYTTFAEPLPDDNSGTAVRWVRISRALNLWGPERLPLEFAEYSGSTWASMGSFRDEMSDPWGFASVTEIDVRYGEVRNELVYVARGREGDDEAGPWSVRATVLDLATGGLTLAADIADPPGRDSRVYAEAGPSPGVAWIEDGSIVVNGVVGPDVAGSRLHRAGRYMVSVGVASEGADVALVAWPGGVSTPQAIVWPPGGGELFVAAGPNGDGDIVIVTQNPNDGRLYLTRAQCGAPATEACESSTAPLDMAEPVTSFHMVMVRDHVFVSYLGPLAATRVFRLLGDDAATEAVVNLVGSEADLHGRDDLGASCRTSPIRSASAEFTSVTGVDYAEVIVYRACWGDGGDENTYTRARSYRFCGAR